jgi:hypothetical protein
MGDTVGREISLLNKDAYILGLWLADGYWWSSSVGISNTDSGIIKRFRKFLEKRFPEERIKTRIYKATMMKKARRDLYHVYVNSRSLLREFRKAGRLRYLINTEDLYKYFAGRFDGDGSVDKDMKTDCRIVYGSLKDADQDKKLLEKLGYKPKTYFYKKAKTYIIYLKPRDAKDFIQKIKLYSIKLISPRRD